MHQLHECADHGLSALPAVPLYRGELGGEVVVKVLAAKHLEGESASLVVGQAGLQDEGLIFVVQPLPLSIALGDKNIEGECATAYGYEIRGETIIESFL